MQREQGLKDRDDYETHRGDERDDHDIAAFARYPAGHHVAAFAGYAAGRYHVEKHTPNRHRIAYDA